MLALALRAARLAPVAKKCQTPRGSGHEAQSGFLVNCYLQSVSNYLQSVFLL